MTLQKFNLNIYKTIALFAMATSCGSVSWAGYSHGSANARGADISRSKKSVERVVEPESDIVAASEVEPKFEDEIEIEEPFEKKKVKSKKTESSKKTKAAGTLIEEADVGAPSKPGMGKRVSGFVGRINPWSSGDKSSKQAFTGYLAYDKPAGLRFAENVDMKKRVPSPALPEFSLLSDSYQSYLLETPLSEEESFENSFYSEVVVEMEPHVLISGNIDFGMDRREMTEDQRLVMEEERDSLLKPEDVLIFFEAGNQNRDVNVVVPVSPSPYNTKPSKSSATYTIEEK